MSAFDAAWSGLGRVVTFISDRVLKGISWLFSGITGIVLAVLSFIAFIAGWAVDLLLSVLANLLGLEGQYESAGAVLIALDQPLLAQVLRIGNTFVPLDELFILIPALITAMIVMLVYRFIVYWIRG